MLDAVARRVKDLPHKLAWAVSPKAAENRARLAAFRDKHRGERCVVIANGPSLARMDLRSLAGEVTIGMNRIYLNFAKMGYATTYLAAVNELVLEQYGEEMQALPMPKFVNWNQRMTIPATEPGVHYLRLSLNLNDHFSQDVTKPICSGGTVTFVALHLAYYMGFRQVILIGLDHRFSSSGVPNQIETRGSMDDRDHFDPRYFPPGSQWQLPDLHRSELAYALARQAFEADGRHVLDATLGGACQVFDKADFNKLIG